MRGIALVGTCTIIFQLQEDSAEHSKYLGLGFDALGAVHRGIWGGLQTDQESYVITKNHKVQAGEAGSVIAQQLNIRLHILEAANPGINQNKLRTRQILHNSSSTTARLVFPTTATPITVSKSLATRIHADTRVHAPFFPAHHNGRSTPPASPEAPPCYPAQHQLTHHVNGTRPRTVFAIQT